LLSLPPGTEMFQFPGFPVPALCVQAGLTGHDPSRVSPFGDPWINGWLTPPQGLSQSPTSFIGSWCQGIHRVLFDTCRTRCSRSLWSSQGTGPAPARRIGPEGPTVPWEGAWIRERNTPSELHRVPITEREVEGRYALTVRARKAADRGPTRTSSMNSQWFTGSRPRSGSG
jgi:hypothetical protein